MTISNDREYQQLLNAISFNWRKDLTNSADQLLQFFLDNLIKRKKEYDTFSKSQLMSRVYTECGSDKTASLSTIQRGLRQLRKLGILTVIHNRNAKGDYGVSTYKLNADVILSRNNYKKKTYPKPQVQKPSQETLNYGKPVLNLSSNSIGGGTVTSDTLHISFGSRSNDSNVLYENKDSQPKPQTPSTARTSLPFQKIKEKLPQNEGRKPPIDVKAFKSPKKTTEEHQATFAWLTSLNLNVDDSTRSWWAYEYDIETLKHVYQKMTKRIAMGFSVRNPGAYMRTILTKSGDLPNNHTVSVKKMVERIKNEAPFPDIEIRDTYCFHPYYPDQEVPFRLTHEEVCRRLTNIKNNIVERAYQRQIE